MKLPGLLLAISLLLVGACTCPAGTVSFARDIRPILESGCWKCHGGAAQLSKLDLRTRESALKGGARGPALEPGNAAESRLYRLVAGLEKPHMPMDGQLTADQVAKIKDWIQEGAPWEGTAESSNVQSQRAALEDMPLPPAARQYWAFRKPMRPAVPPIAANPVDAFLLQKLQEKGLKPAPRADRVTLLRRAYFDLLGLPPTPAEAAEFLNDKSPDAWERLIDRLLASPEYGERWGRHWLDVARYADSNGFEHDFDRPNAWRYRDYVIRSFNEDKPYDRFLREQIAGDELPNRSYDTWIATGFLRSYAKVGFREKDNPEFRYEYLDDMIATIGRGILGLTVQCARCHNHKFDPISQKDYYRLQASLFGYVEVDEPLIPAAQAADYERKVAAVERRLTDLKSQIRAIDQPYRDRLLPDKLKKFPANIQTAVGIPEAQRTPGQVLLANQVLRAISFSRGEIDGIMTPSDLARKKQLEAEVKRVEKTRPPPVPMAMAVTDGDYRFTPDGPGDEPAPGKGVKRAAISGSFLHQGPGCYQVPPSYFLYRGDPNSPGSEMQPGFITVATYGNPPTALPPPDCATSGRRRALAEWLISPDNPLTARVIVNRIWHYHFGRGIVATLDNFGKMGDAPTHPELLDWLATEFVRHGWSIKYMHRLLMTSAAYQMSSQFGDKDNLAKDPANHYFWRFHIQRLDAEAIRDSILAVSGALNRQMFGPPVFPPLPTEVLASMNKGIWRQEDDGPAVWRRSVYVYRKRGLPFPMFEAFDLPNQNISCGARNVSTVPTQALTLLNDDFVLEQAKLFAARVQEASPADQGEQVNLAYHMALSRAPTASERELALQFLRQQKLVDLANVLLNLNEFLYMR